MLDIDHEKRSITDTIDSLPNYIELPKHWADFFSLTGPASKKYDNHRRFRRLHFRGKAILKRKQEFHSIYTKDISRLGVGLLFHEQLFPHESIEVWLSDGTEMALEVVRCLRLQKNCYECGAIFHL